MKLNSTIKVFIIFGSLFLLSSFFIYFLEIVFPYSYFQNNDDVDKNYLYFNIIFNNNTFGFFYFFQKNRD